MHAVRAKQDERPAAALDRWQQSHGEEDLIALFDRATDALIDGIAEMRPRPARSRRRT